MDMDNKIYVAESEYARLCRIDARMDVLIDYVQSKDYMEKEILKLIIGLDNFDK